jgi:hypothetical protein
MAESVERRETERGVVWQSPRLARVCYSCSAKVSDRVVGSYARDVLAQLCALVYAQCGMQCNGEVSIRGL